MQYLSTVLLFVMSVVIIYTKYIDYKQKKEKLAQYPKQEYTLEKPGKISLIYYGFGMCSGIFGLVLGIALKNLQTISLGFVLIAVSLAYLLTFEVTLSTYVGKDNFIYDTEKIRYKSVRKITYKKGLFGKYIIECFNGNELKMSKNAALAISERANIKIQEK